MEILTNWAGGAQTFCLKNKEFFALALSKFAIGFETCFRAKTLKNKKRTVILQTISDFHVPKLCDWEHANDHLVSSWLYLSSWKDALWDAVTPLKLPKTNFFSLFFFVNKLIG